MIAEEEKTGIFKKIKGKFKDRPVRPSSKVKKFVENNLPRYIDEYKLADRSDLNGIDKKVERFMGELDELDGWKKDTERRIEDDKRRVERLKKRVGMKESG
ncbi:MAG: hypothetical protein ACLFSM_00745 [Thermoplasmata archaeon]